MKKHISAIFLLLSISLSQSIHAGQGISSLVYGAPNEQLLSAVQKKSIDNINYAIKNGANVNTKFGDNQNTALHFAAAQNSPETIICLLRNNANINSQNKFKATPLHIAVDKETENAVAKLIENNAFINAKNNYGQTPLHIAVTRENEKIIEILMDYGANPEIKSNSGKKALDFTKNNTIKKTLNNKIKTLKKRTLKQKDLSEISLDKIQKLEEQERKRRIKEIETIKRKEKKQSIKNLKTTIKLEEQERKRRIKEIKNIRKKENKQKELEELRKQFEQTTIEKSNLDNEIKELNEQIMLIKINKSEKEREHLEKENLKTKETIKVLEKEKSKKIENINRKKAATKIQNAYRKYLHIKNVKKQLLEEIALIGKQESISSNQIKKLKHLKLEVTNNPQFFAQIIGVENNTILHLFANHGLLDKGLIEKLIENDCNINTQNSFGITALHLSILQGYNDQAELLINLEADVTISDHEGNNPLHWAILTHNNEKFLMPDDKTLRNNTELIKKLISINKEIIKAVDIDGNSMLHLAAYNGHTDLIEIFITNGVSVNYQNNKTGQTALHWAAIANKPETTKKLIEFGASVLIKNTPPHSTQKPGRYFTPWDFVKDKREFEETAIILDDAYLPQLCKKDLKKYKQVLDHLKRTNKKKYYAELERLKIENPEKYTKIISRKKRSVKK